ncbi:hypothetical protein QYE76_059905 [Lolium multiflorum]|uniref:Transposase (putative) gypsy type domain-containing protein n=1 Tax=Lolium multiflorum TaxID=4521 RepID=A0AAD8RYY7_LOLMU|nr:hypothetical protein QYE76_059905 [Lolium multiflorum]
MPPRTRLTRHSTPESKMATEDLEWERSKISNQDMNLLKKLGFTKKENALRFPKEESYPSPPIEYRLHQLTPNYILHVSIFITLCECFLGVQPNWALCASCLRRNGSPNVAYNIGGVVILENNIAPFDGGAKILRRHSWDAEATEDEKLATEALMTRIHELQNTRGKELSGIQITAYFLRIRVQPLQARTNTLWMYAGEEDVDRLSKDLPVKDLEKLIRRISSFSKKDTIPSSCRITPYSGANPLPEGTSRPESEVAGSQKSAASSEKEAESEATASTRSLPSAVSPKNKRKRDEVTDSGASKAEEAGPSERKIAFNPYEDALVSSGDEDEDQPIDATARTSTSRTLLVSEAQPDGDETSPPQQNIEHPTPPASPRAPSPKRARVESAKEPALLLGSSMTPPLDDPLMKEFICIGTQFVGYRDHAKKAEENLVEANKRADSLARKLEQSEKARKKAEADAAVVEDFRQRLHDAETALSDNISEQAVREAEILSRLQSRSRRFVKTAAADPISGIQEIASGTPRGDSSPGGLYAAMVASGVMFHVGAGISGVAPHYIPPPSTFNVLLDSYWFD